MSQKKNREKANEVVNETASKRTQAPAESSNESVPWQVMYLIGVIGVGLLVLLAKVIGLF
jgi:hypothetical protein